MPVEFRTYCHESDSDGQRELFRLSFPEAVGTPIDSSAHYEWKFRCFPSATPAYEYVAVSDDRIVGYYAALPYEYIFNANPIRVAMVCDVMTHPSERGKGIFTKLGNYATEQLALEGMHCTTGYPIRPEVIPGHLKVGWNIVKHLPVYARPVRAAGLLPKPISTLTVIADPIFRAARFLCNSLLATADITCEHADRDTFLTAYRQPPMQDFIRGWSENRAVHLLKTPEFMEWRTGAPGTEYEFTIARRNGSGLVVGIAVSRRVILKGIPTLAILDCMIAPNTPGAANAIHRALSERAWVTGQSLVAIMTDETSSRELRLRQNCYIKSSAIFSLIVKNLMPGNKRHELDSPEAAWRTFWLDSDDL